MLFIFNESETSEKKFKTSKARDNILNAPNFLVSTFRCKKGKYFG